MMKLFSLINLSCGEKIDETIANDYLESKQDKLVNDNPSKFYGFWVPS